MMIRTWHGNWPGIRSWHCQRQRHYRLLPYTQHACNYRKSHLVFATVPHAAYTQRNAFLTRVNGINGLKAICVTICPQPPKQQHLHFSTLFLSFILAFIYLFFGILRYFFYLFIYFGMVKLRQPRVLALFFFNGTFFARFRNLHAHTRTGAHTYTLKLTHTRTHTHTYIPSYFCCCCCCVLLTCHACLTCSFGRHCLAINLENEKAPGKRDKFADLVRTTL